MSGTDARPNERATAPVARPALSNFWRRQLPYIVAMILAVAGVAYTNVSHRPLVGYWEFLAVAIAAVCIVTRWSDIDGRDGRIRLLWTQALHWAAVLIAMNIILVSSLQQMLPTPATSLVLLMLLALGTVLAGVALLSPQIAFLGVAMGAAVPAISWLQQSVIFFLLGGLLLIGLGLSFWLRQDRPARDMPANTHNQMEH